jgi:hypothetical protein
MDMYLAAARAAYFAGDPLALDELFADIRVDDPRAERVEGRLAVVGWAQASADWFAERRARVTHVATTVHEPRIVGEFDVELTRADASLVLPIALVVEADAADGNRGWLRIYHSHWPLIGRHVHRPPLLPADPDLRESDIVGEYQAALAAGDAARIVATFEPDGCFREPAGPQYRVCGTAALNELFKRFFAAGAGITLEHCSVTDDGVRAALEFNAVRWGTTDMPAQAGIAVYERGPSGLLAHARIYDDVDPPLADDS